MAKVIPTILVQDSAEFQKRANLLKGWSELVQIDINDGKFVSNVSFSDREEIKKFNWGNLAFELHLMIQDVQREIQSWLELKPQRVFFHYEAFYNIAKRERKFAVFQVINQIKAKSVLAGLALAPETKIEAIIPFLDKLDLVMLLSVSPGYPGQKFQRKVIPKIRNLKKVFKSGKIEVDGGINEQNIPLLKEAGADFLAINSAIFGYEDIGKRIKFLQSLAE